MRRTWMLFLFLMSTVTVAIAQNDATDFYRNDGFEAEEPEPEPSVYAPEVSVRPHMRPKPKPKVTVEVATPDDPTITYNKDAKFTSTGKYDRQTKFFKKFQVVFNKCSGGCDAGRAHIHRSYLRTRDKNGQLILDNICRDPNDPSKIVPRKSTCHNSDEAVDIHGIVCGGKNYPAGTSQFTRFVNCIKSESYQGKPWKTIYQSEKHYDHAHFSLGCKIQRRRTCTWKSYH